MARLSCSCNEAAPQPRDRVRAGAVGVRSGAIMMMAAAAIAAPVAAQDVEPARPLAAREADRERAVTCLATAIAYEAGYEPASGQEAVAEVVLNRYRDPAFPKSVCGVIFAGSERRTGCQFSFTCDGSLRRRMSDAVMRQARAVALGAIEGRNPVRVPGATHYHADYVRPYWAPSLSTVGQIGRHIFYRRLGARDHGAMPQPATIGAEPQIAAIDGTTVSSTAVSATTKPKPAVFAPWGLPVGTAGPED
jgi:hypothetical protein